MIRPLLAIGLCVAASTTLAQQPFDMSPELHLRETPAASTVTEPAPTIAQPASSPSGLKRHLLPQSGVRFEGEMGTRAFDFYLTADEAAAPASLDLSVLNSIVVAPEYSNLTVAINGIELAAAPIEYASGPTGIDIDVPDGILVPGRNRIEFAANQRHRTDCSVSSTYELWTEIHGTGTVLELEGADLGSITGLSELPAVGLNANGATELRLFIPQIDSHEARTAALRLVQYLALALKAPALEISLIEGFEAMPETGALTVILGTADALPQNVAALGRQAEAGPVAGIVGQDALPNTLMVSGPDWAAIEVATRSIRDHVQAQADSLGGMRVDISDPVPVITGRSSVSLVELGVDTVEFNGRRYHSALRFVLPADFYANMYSEAELVLDAAYSPAVRPGSQLEIYVNGQIASVVPILHTDGGTFRNSRLRIPMTNFRPGINEIHVETMLLTAEDEICPPGLSGRATPRFLFSADSELNFPEFGRIAQYPDLRATTGTAAPYGGAANVPVIVGNDAASMQAAMMLLGRMALSSGRMVEATVVGPEGANPAADALIIAPMAELSPDLMARGRVAELNENGEVPILSSGEDALARWHESARASSNNLIETARDWIAQQLDLAPENFWLFRRTDGAYLPQSLNAAVLSQVYQPEGGVWTLLTIPNPQAFAASTARLVQPDIWRQIGGRVTAISPDDDAALVLQPRNRTLVPTQPISVTNLRLIAANWLSTHVLGYALLMAVIAVLLTVATSLLLAKRKRAR